MRVGKHLEGVNANMVDDYELPISMPAKEHERPAHDDLEGSSQERRVHEAVANGADRSQFGRHNCNGDSGGKAKVRDEVR